MNFVALKASKKPFQNEKNWSCNIYNNADDELQ